MPLINDHTSRKVRWTSSSKWYRTSLWNEERLNVYIYECRGKLGGRWRSLFVAFEVVGLGALGHPLWICSELGQLASNLGNIGIVVIRSDSTWWPGIVVQTLYKHYLYSKLMNYTNMHIKNTLFKGVHSERGGGGSTFKTKYQDRFLRDEHGWTEIWLCGFRGSKDSARALRRGDREGSRRSSQ